MPNLTHDAIALYGKDALVWKYKACLYIDSDNGLAAQNRISENLNVLATSYYYVSTLVGFTRTRLIVHNVNVTRESNTKLPLTNATLRLSPKKTKEDIMNEALLQFFSRLFLSSPQAPEPEFCSENFLRGE
jgi:hypothetical protein